MSKKIFLFLMSIMTISGIFSLSTFASENTHTYIDSEIISEVTNIATESELTEEDLDFVLDSDEFMEEHQRLEEQGWILQDISVDDVYSSTSYLGASTYKEIENKTYSNGKIVKCSYVQPEKTKTYYNNKIYASASKLKLPISVAANFLPGKVSWVATAVFSINVGDLTPCFNNGYEKLIVNSTLFTTTAYAKVGSKYYAGLITEYEKKVGTVVSYYHDKDGSPHQSQAGFSKTYYGEHAKKTHSQLIALAKKYNSGNGYTYADHPKYTSDVLTVKK